MGNCGFPCAVSPCLLHRASRIADRFNFAYLLSPSALLSKLCLLPSLNNCHYPLLPTSSFWCLWWHFLPAISSDSSSSPFLLFWSMPSTTPRQSIVNYITCSPTLTNLPGPMQPQCRSKGRKHSLAFWTQLPPSLQNCTPLVFMTAVALESWFIPTPGTNISLQEPDVQINCDYSARR